MQSVLENESNSEKEIQGMDIDEKLIPALKKIDFVERYISICKEFWNFENSMNKNCKEEIYDFIKSRGFNAKYSSNENFYKILTPIKGIAIQFNIIPYNGFIQFVWDVKLNGNRLNLSWGVWESITSELAIGESLFIDYPKKPVFTNLEDLERILNLSFDIHQDFVKEVEKVN